MVESWTLRLLVLTALAFCAVVLGLFANLGAPRATPAGTLAELGGPWLLVAFLAGVTVRQWLLSAAAGAGLLAAAAMHTYAGAGVGAAFGLLGAAAVARPTTAKAVGWAGLSVILVIEPVIHLTVPGWNRPVLLAELCLAVLAAGALWLLRSVRTTLVSC